jgi:hypothetical protein
VATSALPHPTKIPKDGEAWMWYVVIWGLAAALFAGAILGALATYVVFSLTGKNPSSFTTGAAGVTGTGIYYAFQATFTWRFWIKSYKDQSGNVKQRGRQNANNGGFNIHAEKGASVTMTAPAPVPPPTVNVVLSHAPPPPTLPAPPSPIVAFSDSTAPKPPTSLEPIVVLDESFEVTSSAFVWRGITCTRGDTLRGTIESDQPLTAYLMAEADFMRLQNGREASFHFLLDDELATEVKWKAPKSARFRVVFDAKGKQNPRRVTVRLERTPAMPKARAMT